MNFEEIAEAISEAQQQGKIQNFGVSNFETHQLEILSNYVEVVTNQIEISLTHLTPFEDGSLNQLLHKNIQPTAWSPLGGGELFSEGNEQAVRIMSELRQLQEKYGAKPDQLMLTWLRKHPSGIIPVLGTSKLSRIETALEAMTIDLSHEDWYRLWTASKGTKVA